MSGDTLAFRRPTKQITASTSLTVHDSGKLIRLAVASGATVTLPAFANCGEGTFFDFVVETTVTSNSYKIITGAGTELLVGSIINCDTDSSDAVAIWKALVGSSYISVNLDGSTKGGIKGDYFRLTCVNATTWHVTGVTNGTSAVATPFATS
jgi:hypothetical protein